MRTPRTTMLARRAGTHDAIDNAAPGLEPLEARRVMSGVTLSAGTLTISGSEGGDVVELTQDSARYHVSLNGSVTSWLRGHVARVHAELRAGDDVFEGWPITGAGAPPMTINGGRGVDVVSGGDGADVIDGGDDVDWIFGQGGGDRITGGGGDDVIYGGTGRDTLFGNAGNDTLEGNDGNDIILGGDGIDTIHGRNGNDEIWGGNGADLILGGDKDDTLGGEEGDDTIEGEDGDDEIEGGPGADTLRGQSGNDTLKGGDDNDVLEGGAGHDNLYGMGGLDDLHGGDGNDGLAPGLDGIAEFATGGGGADRFLLPRPEIFAPGSAVMAGLEDDAEDLAGEDTRLWFEDGGSYSFNFTDPVTGAPIPVEYSTAAWSGDDLFLLDQGLAALHRAVGNVSLLENSLGRETLIRRAGVPGPLPSGASFAPSAWNSGGTLTFSDAALVDLDAVRYIVPHEFAHNWDTEYDGPGWEALSGWATLASPRPAGFEESGDGRYMYLATARFVEGYAKYNPREDFACSFANFVMNLEGWSWTRSYPPTYFEISLIPEKNGFMEEFIVAMA